MKSEYEFCVWIAYEYSATAATVCAKNESQARLRFLKNHRLRTGDNSIPIAKVMVVRL